MVTGFAESEDLVASLRSLLPPDSVAEYPAWETLPHERLSPRADTVGRRLAVLRRLRHPNTGPDDDPATGPIKVVVAPIRSVLTTRKSGSAPARANQGNSPVRATTTAAPASSLVGRAVTPGTTSCSGS